MKFNAVYRGPDIYTVLDECNCESSFGTDEDGEVRHYGCECGPDEVRFAIYDGDEFGGYVYKKKMRFY